MSDIQCVFSAFCTAQCRLATFPALHGHTGTVAAPLDRAGLACSFYRGGHKALRYQFPIYLPKLSLQTFESFRSPFLFPYGVTVLFEKQASRRVLHRPCWLICFAFYFPHSVQHHLSSPAQTRMLYAVAWCHGGSLLGFLTRHSQPWSDRNGCPWIHV